MKIGLVILAVVLLLAGVWLMGVYNRIVSLDEGADTAWAQVENVLQRRYDLIPNLVSTVKGYAAHESTLLEDITRLRSQWAGAQGAEAKAEAASLMEGALARLMVVVENYPELKANQNFLALQDELAGTENRISVERGRFNEAVRTYNTAVRRFPANKVAALFDFASKKSYFEAAQEAEKPPVVQF